MAPFQNGSGVKKNKTVVQKKKTSRFQINPSSMPNPLSDKFKFDARKTNEATSGLLKQTVVIGRCQSFNICVY